MVCEKCGGSRWVPMAKDDGTSCVKECECAKLRKLKSRIATILRDWPEYSNASIEGFKPRSVGQQNAAALLRHDIDGSYFFTGLYKRGKTFFTVAQYRALALAGQKCELRSARDLMEELRRSEVPATKDGECVPSEVVRMVTNEPKAHLFIDDIEKVSGTAFRSEMLWDIFDTIKRRQLKLTVSSNLNMIPELKDKLGEAIVSRISQLCKVVEL